MALRKIEYTVNAGGISPSTQQFGGIQGEHNATELKFTLADGFVKALFESAGDNTLLYRIESHTGAGTKNSTPPIKLEHGQQKYDIVYPLNNWLTKDGGNIRVYLIISILKQDENGTENKNLMDLYSFPALLRLNGVPNANFTDGENYESITSLSESARAAAMTAKECAASALNAAARAEDVQTSLNGGAEFIFCGGDAESAIDVSLAVDDQVNEHSNNPVQNAAVYTYINEALKQAVKDVAKDIKLAAHPVGSYYFSTKPDSPADIFGGVWEQVSDKFILAAGEDYTAGDIGGNKVHTHTLEHGYAMIGQSMVNSGCIAWKRTNDSYNDHIATYRTSGVGIISIEDPEKEEAIAASTLLGGFADEHSNMPPYEVAYCWKRTA